ncbi:MAG: FAD-binding protein [Gammaproteobacteria bacterium]|jgi:succinate dehydrogenase/fumarate reductase flavoprotein subunit|nr:FAD-binding protein [Gammaproteobacteria bacterium]MBP6051326.1 FAD-binding protein [Pseudomonadales bacterium]MBK6581673.1 FAD-binding protein [Gammaproteobacteria bacterium]MBK7170136.1 FAD-binding protein [Gammaproteobacteria bacterium]MBK7522434.1 FAD-binding protein [Gammaproteobacteria bacterium]
MLVNQETIAHWSDEADVIVLGAGMAGTCAAIEACESGADVLLVERASGPGGTSALAGGHFYLGGGTPVQTACGFEDSVEEMYKYLVAVSPEPEPAIIRAYCEHSVEHFHWLEAHGVEFERSYHPQKTVLQAGKDCLIWSGNEKVWPYREQARPAPRGHKVAIEGDQGGAFAMRALSESAHNAGVRLVVDARASALVIDAQQRVVGVRLMMSGGPRDIRARRGVVIATGGFNRNEELVARYIPQLAQVERQGTLNDDGSGILIGEAAGGETRHMHGTLITSPFYPDARLLKGIVVNTRGERFVAEDSYHGRTGAMTLAQPGSAAYLIVDAEIFAYPEYQCQPLIDGWESIVEMETGLNLPPGSLQKTLADYNRHAANGADPVFHKYPDWLKPLDTAPFAAFDLTLGKAQYLCGLTLGGLRVSEHAEVLDSQGVAIPGLYAAGSAASTIAQDGIGYASGTGLGQASFFGRRAGRHAGQRIA